MNTTKTPKTKTLAPCRCATATVTLAGNQTDSLPKRMREIAEFDAETNQTFVVSECSAMTASTFAPGHDARFKGLAQIAYRLGGELGIAVGDLMVSGEPIAITTRVSPGLVDAVSAPVAAPKPRSRKAKTKVAIEAAKIRAKVGRWEYEGTIDKTTGNFLYIDAKGVSKMASAFTEI